MLRNRFGTALICLALSAVCAGCVVDGPQPRRKPHIGPQPRDAQADVLLLNIGPPTDNDGDTIPDTFVSSVHIFDSRYQLPVRVDGTMTFNLFAQGSEVPIHSWKFTGRELQQQVLLAQVGPVHRFRLTVPIDSEPVREKYVTVQCLFVAPDGKQTQAWHKDLPWLSFGR